MKTGVEGGEGAFRDKVCFIGLKVRISDIEPLEE